MNKYKVAVIFSNGGSYQTERKALHSAVAIADAMEYFEKEYPKGMNEIVSVTVIKEEEKSPWTLKRRQ